jgi:hypothetical protein
MPFLADSGHEFLREKKKNCVSSDSFPSVLINKCLVMRAFFDPDPAQEKNMRLCNTRACHSSLARQGL